MSIMIEFQNKSINVFVDKRTVFPAFFKDNVREENECWWKFMESGLASMENPCYSVF